MEIPMLDEAEWAEVAHSGLGAALVLKKPCSNGTSRVELCTPSLATSRPCSVQMSEPRY